MLEYKGFSVVSDLCWTCSAHSENLNSAYRPESGSEKQCPLQAGEAPASPPFSPFLSSREEIQCMITYLQEINTHTCCFALSSFRYGAPLLIRGWDLPTSDAQRFIWYRYTDTAIQQKGSRLFQQSKLPLGCVSFCFWTVWPQKVPFKGSSSVSCYCTGSETFPHWRVFLHCGLLDRTSMDFSLININKRVHVHKHISRCLNTELKF